MEMDLIFHPAAVLGFMPPLDHNHASDSPYTLPTMPILSRKTCLKALLLAVFAIQIYGATASSKKAVSVEKLTPNEIEEALQVYTRLSYTDIVSCILFV